MEQLQAIAEYESRQRDTRVKGIQLKVCIECFQGNIRERQDDQHEIDSFPVADNSARSERSLQIVLR